MPKSLSSAMQTHLAEDATRLCTIWRITRTDGEQFFFTDTDEDVVFNGDTYKAPNGFERTAITTSADFAVDNVDFTGFFADGEIEEDEVRAGLFDGASMEVSLISWDDPDGRGEIKLRRGIFGEWRITQQGFFSVEVRGLAQPLQQRTLNLYSPICRADLGDDKCKFPIKPPEIERDTAYALGDFVRVPTDEYGVGFGAYEDRIYECTSAGTTDSSQPEYDTTIGQTTTDGTAEFTARDSFMRVATVASVTNQREFVTSSALSSFVDDHFNEGVLTWETGNNAGVSYEVKDWKQGSLTMELWEGARLEIQVGDQFRVYRGCQKRVVEDCRDIFQIPGSKDFANGNVKNFRGEPHVPGGGLLTITPNAAGSR